MKVAVTGATGFIGKYVLRELAKRDHVQVIASSRTSPDPALLWSNCRYVQLDVASPPQDSFERLESPDVLIHLAWSGLPNFNSLHHFDSHLFEQYRFLALLVRSGLRSLLCSGTCFEYGMVSGELSEDLTPDPKNAYAFAKDSLRKSLSLLRDLVRFEFTWARLFYMYGEGQAPTSLYSQLMNAGRSGQTSFKMSAGEQLRDFMPVEDLASALVSLALDAPGAGIVNVCSGQPVSVRSMVERWIKQNGWTIELELGYYPYPDYEPMAFWGSDLRLRELLKH